MMTTDEEFNIEFQKQDGIFDFAFLDPTGVTTGILEDMRRKLAYQKSLSPNLPEAYLGFTNSLKFGASAKLSNGKYFIGVNIGVFFILTNIFGRMMCDKNVLPDIGEVEIEVGPNKVFDPQYRYALDSIKDSNFDGIQVPNCPIRLLAAKSMLSIAYEFLIMHEYGHICNGHLNFIKKDGKSEIAEAQYNANNIGADSLLYQTLEMDADSNATRIGINKLINDNIPKTTDKDYLTSELGKKLSVWSFAVYSMFRLFGRRGPMLNYTEESHPPVGVRQIMMFGTACTCLQKLNENQSLESSLQIFRNIPFQVENAFKEMSGIPLTAEAIKFGAQPEGINLINSYLRKWADIRPKLQGLAYQKLAEVQKIPN